MITCQQVRVCYTAYCTASILLQDAVLPQARAFQAIWIHFSPLLCDIILIITIHTDVCFSSAQRNSSNTLAHWSSTLKYKTIQRNNIFHHIFPPATSMVSCSFVTVTEIFWSRLVIQSIFFFFFTWIPASVKPNKRNSMFFFLPLKTAMLWYANEIND